MSAYDSLTDSYIAGEFGIADSRLPDLVRMEAAPARRPPQQTIGRWLLNREQDSSLGKPPASPPLRWFVKDGPRRPVLLPEIRRNPWVITWAWDKQFARMRDRLADYYESAAWFLGHVLPAGEILIDDVLFDDDGDRSRDHVVSDPARAFSIAAQRRLGIVGHCHTHPRGLLTRASAPDLEAWRTWQRLTRKPFVAMILAPRDPDQIWHSGNIRSRTYVVSVQGDVQEVR